MGRLIDVDVLRMHCGVAEKCDGCERRSPWNCDKQMYSARDFCGWLDDAPIVDAEPVRHGRWIEVDEGDGDYTYNCSVCGLKWWLPADTTVEENEMNYCPRCGAKMDG